MLILDGVQVKYILKSHTKNYQSLQEERTLMAVKSSLIFSKANLLRLQEMQWLAKGSQPVKT